MRILRLAASILAAVSALGCESADTIGPTASISPSDQGPVYTEPGDRGFKASTTGDRTESRFCDEAERTAQIANMVNEPILPDQSVGGVPFWDSSQNPLLVDSLIGTPEDDKLCDPTGEYANAFTWGPLNEIIVFFDQETRLIDGVQVNINYGGALQGTVTTPDGTSEVLIRTRDRVSIGGQGNQAGRELDQYSGSAEQEDRGNSWLNHQNITLIYGMIRETFFDEEPLAAGFDCVAEQRCDIIYTSPDEAIPQQTQVQFQDSGVVLVFSPEGQVLYVIASPVRKADFELGGEVSTGDTESNTVAPTFVSNLVTTCQVNLAADMTFGAFRSACIGDDVNDIQLLRANYNVYAQRDAVEVGFDGILLSFMRDTAQLPVYRDGARPDDEDRLFSITYTRLLPAATRQFVASELAASYQTRLREHLRANLLPETDLAHPFQAFDIAIPETLAADPQRIGELQFVNAAGQTSSWVPTVLDEVRAAHAAMTAEQRAAVAQDALSETALIEPFVDAVLAAFSFGQSDQDQAFKAFATTNNQRWSFGYGHFSQDGVPYRILVQYSLNFGAVTAVTLGLGYSTIDRVFNAINADAQEGGWPFSYYDLRLADAANAPNPYRLGGDGIEVIEADRQLNTLQVQLTNPENGESFTLWTPGAHLDDRAGFLRQLRGERYEFVPAHEVVLNGRETAQVFYVLPDGSIDRIEQSLFKGAPPLCPGLAIAYGDNVRKAVAAWQADVGPSAYQSCDLVFNYSEDGHVLASVTSLANKILFSTTAERATGVAIWR